MPDGYDRQPTGERPARRGVAPKGSGADRYVRRQPADDDYEEASDDGARGRSGRARRIASWLGFGPVPEEADLYDDPAAGARPGVAAPGRGEEPWDDGFLGGLGMSDDDAGEPRGLPPRPQEPPPGARAGSGEPRARRRGPSPWEDIMLGTGLSPGTPMSDAVPPDTLPPTDVPTVLPAARSALPRRPMPPAYGDMATPPRPRPPDGVDPLDPADPTEPPEPGEHEDPATAPAFSAGRFGLRVGARPEDERDDSYPTTRALRLTPPVDIVDVVDIAERTDATDRTLPAPLLLSHENEDARTPPAPQPSPVVPPDPAPVPAAAAEAADAPDEGPEGPEPRRMLRLMPTPVLADGGGMVVDGGRLGQLAVRAAGVRGSLHQQQGIPRGNTFAVGPDPTGRWAISVLCDGVEGVYAAELAAQVAVRSAFRSVARMVSRERHEEWDWNGLMAALDLELADRLGRVAERAQESGRRGPATRMAVLVTAADQADDDRVDMAVVGDSTVLRLAEGGWRAPLGISEMGVDDQPPALPGDGLAQLKVCRTTWRPTDALVMMTGGFAASLGEPTGGLAAHLADQWRKPPELFDFLGDVDQGLGTRTDDAAVVGLWPRT